VKRWLPHALQLPILVLVAALLALFLHDVSVRAAYPYDIEWMEGGMLAHAWRLRQGLGLYTEPDADWVPYIYPPLYPWVLSLIGEPSYLIARSLSAAGSLAAMAAAVFAVRREGAHWGIALAAGGLWLTCYDDSGSFYDLVRNDALAIGLASWAFALCRVGTRRAVVASGLLLFLAFLAKHNYAAWGVVMLGWLVKTRGWRRGLEFAAASVVPALTATIAIQIATDGLFLSYLLEVPGTHPLNAKRAWPVSEKELALSLVLTSGGALLVGLYALVRRRFSEGGAYWGMVLAMAIGFSILMRAHHGGYVNVLMPGHWTLAVCGAGMLGALARWHRHPLVLALVVGLICGQLWYGRWDDSDMLPTAEDRAAGDQVIQELQALDGSVFAPHFPWYPVMAGKQPSTPLISIWDISHKDGPMYEQSKLFDQALAEHKWDYLLMPSRGMKHGMDKHYTKDHRIPIQGGGTFMTRTGWRTRPAWIHVPRVSDDAKLDEAALAPDEQVAPMDDQGPGTDQVDLDGLEPTAGAEPEPASSDGP
jgi:hypothetical protein